MDGCNLDFLKNTKKNSTTFYKKKKRKKTFVLTRMLICLLYPHTSMNNFYLDV